MQWQEANRRLQRQTNEHHGLMPIAPPSPKNPHTSAPSSSSGYWLPSVGQTANCRPVTASPGDSRTDSCWPSSRAVLSNLNFFCEGQPSRRDPKDHQPPTTNHQPPTTTNHKLPGQSFRNPFFFFLLRTTLKDRPQGPPTANRHQRPTAGCHQPPTAANCHQPPTANRHQPWLEI